MTRRALAGLLLCFVACSDDPASAPPPSVVTDAGAPESSLVATTEDCAPGTRAAVGTIACMPVGTTTCAAGFAKDPSGWGCAAVLPPSACSGATRPALGETACVPVGDCSGAFPPANAIIVDPSLADAAVDATHVKTLADAMAVAGNGATIALVDGEHVASFAEITKDVTIVGRCAGETRVVPDTGGTGGMRVNARATVRGITFAGVDTPFEVFGATAVLELEDAVLEASRGRAVFVRVDGTATLRRVVVRGTVSRTGAGEQTIAIQGGAGAKLDVEDSAILDSFDCALAASDDGDTRVTMKRSVIDGTTAGAIRAFEGAHLDVVESVVRHAGGIAVLTIHRNRGYPEVTLTRSVITETNVSTETGNELSTAINAAFGAIVKVDDTTIADTKGVGIYSAETAKITLTSSVVTRVRENAQSSGNGVTATRRGEISLVDSAVVDTTGLGIGAFNGSKVHVERSLVRAIGGAVVEGVSLGFALNAISGSTMTVVDSSLVDAKEISVATSNAGTRVTLDRVLLARTPSAKPAEYGHGILAGFESVVDVTGSIIDRHTGAALFYAAGAGSVTRSLVRANGIGAHVQEGSILVEAESAPEAPAPLELVVTTDVEFSDNSSKTGTGNLPLPALPSEE